MKRTLRSLFVIAALLPGALVAFPAQASHIPGGHITYTQLSATTYQVTLELYRNCDGIALPQTANVSVRGEGCNFQAQQNTLQLVPSLSDIEVSDVNPGQATACSTPPNPGVLGIKKYTYAGTISVQGTNCTGYIFSYTECCRHAANNNVINPNSANLYFETYASIAVSGLTNTSPVMSGVPCPYVCMNDTVTYLPQITDPDGDSLVFSLVSSRSAPADLLQYPAGFSATQPFGAAIAPLYDNSTGLMTFKPTATGLFTVVQQVDEYRTVNGQTLKVGSMQHDAQFYVMNCTSSLPRFSGTILLNQSPSGVTTWPAGAVIPVEAGQPLQIGFNAHTSDPLLTLQVSANQQLEIPGAMFTGTSAGNLAAALFSWAPTAQQVRNRPYYFSYRFRDSASPVPNDLYGVIKLRVQTTTGTAETAAATAIPNVLSPQAPFSPVFAVPNSAAGEYALAVYDRLGRTVYQSRRYANDWSGAEVAGGLYLYRLQHVQTGKVLNGKLTVLK